MQASIPAFVQSQGTMWPLLEGHPLAICSYNAIVEYLTFNVLFLNFHRFIYVTFQNQARLIYMLVKSTVWQMGEHRAWQQRLDLLLGFCISLGPAHHRPGANNTKHLKVATLRREGLKKGV